MLYCSCSIYAKMFVQWQLLKNPKVKGCDLTMKNKILSRQRVNRALDGIFEHP